MKRSINYFGSKYRAAGRIHQLIPEGPEVWVDLFFGSGIVTLKKTRHKKEIVNDLNDDVINLFKVLQDEKLTRYLMAKVELTPYSEELLYRCRRESPANQIDKAWSFLVRCWLGRGGIKNTGFRWSKSQTTAPEITWTRLPERARRGREKDAWRVYSKT